MDSCPIRRWRDRSGRLYIYIYIQVYGFIYNDGDRMMALIPFGGGGVVCLITSTPVTEVQYCTVVQYSDYSDYIIT